MGNFWIDANQRNTLKGDPLDLENPVVLPDEYIVYCLHRSEKAWSDLTSMLPSLLPGEQERLNALITENPYLVRPFNGTPLGDSEQARFNNIPVYTAGRGFGGSGFRRSVLPNTYPVKKG